MGAPLARLPVFSPVAPDKRGRCQQPQGRLHTPPPAAAGQLLSRNGGKGGGGRGGARLPSAPALPWTPRLREESALSGPRRASRPARPSAPFPGESKPRTGLRRDAAGGLCGRVRGRLLVLSSRGWVRPDRRAVGRRRGRDWAAAAAGPRASGLQPLAEGRASAATHRNAALRTASLLPLSGGGRRRRRLRARSLL